jgi:uncharacterized protein YndB with AHSA1/START domain
MSIKFEVSDIIPAPVEAVFNAWLNSEEHAKMTGAHAEVSAEVGAVFEAWDGYIKGVNVEVEENKRIVQRWRTTEFEENDADSLLEVLFEAEGKGTRVTIRHSELPKHGMQYKQGWKDSYFTPMKAYFGNK